MRELNGGIQEWVINHPYLEEIAKLQQLVESAGGASSPRELPLEKLIANQEELLASLEKGLPAMQTARWLEGAVSGGADLLQHNVAAFAAAQLPRELQREIAKIARLLEKEPSLLSRFIEEILRDNYRRLAELEETGANRDLIEFLAWGGLVFLLQPLREYVEQLQQEGGWGRAYCPVCGQLPAMAQLIKTEKGRERDLVCGCCQTRWRYKRLGCPYCENDDLHSINIIESDELQELRVDTCDRCQGYLKTYTGEGNEKLMLADWSTLHLDVIGEQQGFQRMGYRRYRL